MSIDFRRAVKYPPEVFLWADTVDLEVGDNTLFEYTNLEYSPAYILTLQGVSLDNGVTGVFSVSADDLEAMKIDVPATKGIQYNEDVRIVAEKSMKGSITVTSAVSGFRSRHLLKVDRATPLLKNYYGFEIYDRDKELMSKYNIKDVNVSEFNPFADKVYRVVTSGKAMTTDGTVLKVSVPKDKKVILLDIATSPVSDADKVNISISRDGINDVMTLDAYCLPPMSVWFGSRYLNAMRVVAVDELIIEATVTEPVTIRATYAIGYLTLEEKVKWGLRMSSSEIKEANEKNLFELAEAGLI